ncbi:MAG TPA: hypothetical protein VII75_08840 [Thermoanaerobaculia bacterium]
MTESIRWDARHILRQIADADLRRDVLSSFWRHGDAQSRAMAIATLAKALHFREETIRKMPPPKKADLLATRLTAPEFEQVLEMALMQYHTHDKNEMLAAFLDHWKVPHENGSIENDEYTAPAADQVRDAVNTLTQFPKRDVVLYLASAGLLMGGEWRDATWPVVDELVASLT